MRSYVDPIINAAVISQVDLRKDFVNLRSGDFPRRYLPTVLHESTHHWCFMTPLGLVLALLRMRAYRNATYLRTRPNADHSKLLEDVLRQEMAIECLRPIAEGLACFSELDSVPGESGFVTEPMRWAFVNFGGSDKKMTEEFWDNMRMYLFSLLHSARLDPDLAQRRENVLAGRFPIRFGGHLPGYLAVKSIWHQAKMKTGRARDAELFLHYMRAYIYEDYAFIGVLLDYTRREKHATEAIAEYWRKRAKQLLLLDWDTALEQYEKELYRTVPATRKITGFIHPLKAGLFNDATLQRRGMDGFEEMFSELEDGAGKALEMVQAFERRPRWARIRELLWPRAGIREVGCIYDRERVGRRQLLCLGSVDAKIEVTTGGRAPAFWENSGMPDGFPPINAPAIEGVEPGVGDGCFAFYLLTRDYGRAYAILRGDEVVFVAFEGLLNEEKKKEITWLLSSRSTDLRVIEENERNLEFVMARNEVGTLRSKAKKEAAELIEMIYSWLLSIPIQQWEEKSYSVAQKLERGGFYELCGKDGDFIRGLSLLGVVASVNDDRNEVAKIAQARGFDLDELVLKARSIETETGVALLRDVNGRVLVRL